MAKVKPEVAFEPVEIKFGAAWFGGLASRPAGNPVGQLSGRGGAVDNRDAARLGYRVKCRDERNKGRRARMDAQGGPMSRDGWGEELRLLQR